MKRAPGKESLEKFVKALKDGQLIGLPTETVYGLAADATKDNAVAGIFEAKGRPQFNPLIIHGDRLETLTPYAHFNDRALKLAEAFWPGPLTLVLPRKATSNLSLLVTAGLDTVAVRIPNHPVARDLIANLGNPIAAPSANPSGTISPTCAEDVETGLGNKLTHILDGGPCQVGLESTIVDLTGDEVVLLRPGGINMEELDEVVGSITPHQGTDIKSPGMMKSHYAPSLPVLLNVTAAEEKQAHLGFGAIDGTLNLSPSSDLKEAAANLFGMMRQLDNPIYSAIAIAPIPLEGLGLAINDRIQRAAT